MRLRRLDLTRYGKFTDFRIEFGAAEAGRPDLHIVHGPNEAGKSTAFSAFLDLLFGIGKSSDYAFLHAYPTMRIGAALDLDGGTREFVRIKRDQNTLLDGHDQPVGEAVLRGALAGIDRDGYRHMFSLDDRTLEDGGKSILASKGDLGQLLFSASAGLADLGRSLDRVKAEADAFSRPYARDSELLTLKKRLGELRDERDRIDTLASHYGRLVEARDRARDQYEGTVAASGHVKARLRAIDRQLGALPRLHALRELRADLARLADLPESPPWAGEVGEMRKAAITLAVQRDGIAQTLADLDAALAADLVDEDALACADAVEALAGLRARTLTAEDDLPNRRQRRRDIAGEIAFHLQRLGRPEEQDPARLVLSAAATGRLRALLEARSGVETATRTASTELAEARRRLDEAAAAMPAADGAAAAEGAPEHAVAALGATLTALRSSDHAARLRVASRDRERAFAEMADRLRELRPWSGEVETLVEVQVPGAATLARWRTAASGLERRIERETGEVDRLASALRRQDAERAALTRAAGVADDREAAAARGRRDAAWADHRRALDEDSAGRFEVALRDDDAVTASRLAATAQLAELRQVDRGAAATRTEHACAAERLEAARGELRTLDGERASATAAAAPALAGMDLPAFETWCGRRDAALLAAARFREADREVRATEDDGATLRRQLAEALAGVGAATDARAEHATLMATGQRILDAAREDRARREALAGCRRDVAARERIAEAASEAARRWEGDWLAACAGCWLGETGETPPPEAVREILAVLDGLAPLLRDRAQLADRIEKMEADQAQYRAGLLGVAMTLGMPIDAAPLDVARAIDRRIAGAQSARDRRQADLGKRDEAKARQSALAADVERHAQRAAAMTGYFRVADLDQVAAKIAASEARASLERQVREAEAEILLALGGSCLAEAEAALDLADRGALEDERGKLDERSKHLERRCQELYAEMTRARDAVEGIGGDAEAAAIEVRRRTTLLEIEDGALRYLKLRAGALAAEHALRIYRDRHRSGMMVEASRAFRTVTRGAYTGLTTQPGKDGETLVAVPAGGGSKAANQLSKGTCFQLYLALRVAGYREFARDRRPVPFVADDILETFDDDRAEEALRLLADMAGSGQVIYLTHHPHLCTIARKVCPDVRIHELTPGPA